MELHAQKGMMMVVVWTLHEVRSAGAETGVSVSHFWTPWLLWSSEKVPAVKSRQDYNLSHYCAIDVPEGIFLFDNAVTLLSVLLASRYTLARFYP